MLGDEVSIVLLGTAGGPPLWPDSDRAGCATAVVVGPRLYLVDMGEGWRLRLRQSGSAQPRYPGALAHLEAAFITHLHSDHVVDYPNLVVMGVTDGRRDRPVRVLGPTGTEAMTQGVISAFDADLRDRLRGGRNPPPSAVVHAEDITLPTSSPAQDEPRGDDSWTTPVIAPFRIYEDDHVSVSATLAFHPPLTPCFGFRFDTDRGSVTFSGDTAPHENIRHLARGTDILVHEAVDSGWARTALATAGRPQVLEHFLGSHTSAEDAAALATEIGATTLVLHHLVPANLPDARWRELAQGFEGERLRIGRDLDVIRLPAGRG